ncbi:MAG: DUF3106 domain-containing protein [Proteobacteria bacterium]|nr:DUF3106 domain-containing protein [Pseudomonadota bacterium]
MARRNPSRSGQGLLLAVLFATAWLCAAPAVADDETSSRRSQPAPGVPWTQLTPEQQKMLEAYRERWSSIPPERQQAIARSADRWQQMSPEQQQQAEQRLQQWQSLPPEGAEEGASAVRPVSRPASGRPAAVARGVQQIPVVATRATRTTA